MYSNQFLDLEDEYDSALDPCEIGGDADLQPPATVLVIFGASGDLTNRKLVPALVNLLLDKQLPDQFVLFGAARTAMTDEEFRARLLTSISKHSRRPIPAELWEQFAANVFYQKLDATRVEDFTLLRERISEMSTERGEQYNRLFYLATAPDHVIPIAHNLDQVGLMEDYVPGGITSAIVIEKPFGHDLATAKSLNAELASRFSERQIFRIDHYLGKETVQNILAFRFGNGIFEPLWNNNFIESIEITVAEELGVGTRAGYFDTSGITRDIVQNHALQMLSLLTIEPPISLLDPDAIRDEKVKVLKSIKRFNDTSIFSSVVRGRYSSGLIKGEHVPGYLEEPGVAPTSTTETFVAMKLQIDNWRWSGVPMFLRVGKRLPKRMTEIAVKFKRQPARLLKGCRPSDPNVLVFQVQPEEGIHLTVNSKMPGPRYPMRPVTMDFTNEASFGVQSPDAYERLLVDAMRADPTLFARGDEIEEAWSIIDPILTAWSGPKAPPLFEYPAGSVGPDASEQLLAWHRASWRAL